MGAPGFSIEADLADGYGALGYMQGFAEVIKTDRFVGSVLDYAHGRMAEVFNESINVTAAGSPSLYHHVYEQKLVGVPGAELWKHRMLGRGSTREASFEWKASLRPILTPEERLTDENPIGDADPIHGVDPKVIEKLKPRHYIFYNKAPMMEFGLRAVVEPQWSRILFVPSFRSASHGGYYRAMHTVQDFSKANPQDASGGRGTVGNFTAAWVGWWKDGADMVWATEIKNVVERDLGRSEREMGAIPGRRRASKKVLGLVALTNNEKAFQAGRNYAAAHVYRKADSYKKASTDAQRRGIFD